MQLLPRAQRSATKAQFLVGGQKTQVFCPPEDGKISIVPPVSGAQPKRNPFSGRSAIYFQDVFRWEQDNKTSAIHNRINVIRPRHLYFPCSQMHPPCREGNERDPVRTQVVLDWCLKLERDGILGADLVFSATEKAKAAAAGASYTINYNGPVANSQVQQNTSYSSQQMQVGAVDKRALGDFILVLNEHVRELGLGPAEARRMQSEMTKLESEAAVPEPNR